MVRALVGLGWVLGAFACRPAPRVEDPVTGTSGSGAPTLVDTLVTTPSAPSPHATVTLPLARPVVEAAHPLALDNPQQTLVAWPVWGGSFTVDRPVRLHVAMTGGDESGERGLLLAGPGAVTERAAVALVRGDDGWLLRELSGTTTVQELPLRPDERGDFLLDVAPDGVELTGAGLAELALGAPLARGTDAVGVYVVLDPGTTLSITELSVDEPLPLHPELGPPLRDLAVARDRDMGTATDVWPPLHDLGFESLLPEQFGRAAPTEFYWSTTRGEDPDWFVLPADLMVNEAVVHHQSITGMFLVWDYALPAWLGDYASSHPPDALQDLLDDHITTLVSRYRGRVDTWVVVNEAVWGPDDWWGRRARYADNLWFDHLGPDYIEDSFRSARAADPDAKLMYNETGAEEPNEKSDFVYDMLSDFRARGVPVDALGLQFHLRADAPPDPAAVQANLERFAALGLDVDLTEIDVSLEGVGGTDQERLDLQASIYAQIVGTCLAVPRCRTTTVFGFTDRYAWDELGDASPLLFTADYQPKPAFWAVQSALEP